MTPSTWTDERLEDLSKRVDSGFERVNLELLDIRGEIRAMRSDLTTQTDSVRSDLTAQTDSVRSDLTQSMDLLRSDMTQQIDSLRSLMIRLTLGTTLVVLVAIATRSL